MNAVVVGFGSIGSRHARILNELGCHTSVVSKREVGFKPSYRSLPEAIQSERPAYVVVANRTAEHGATLSELKKLGFGGTVLSEKPLFADGDFSSAEGFSRLVVGYNLRFHPLLKRLNALLKNETLISAQCYVGQYLPEWRPSADYKNNYSAKSAWGGGVLRDLSHELDYCQWLFGRWEALTAQGGHWSSLEIDSDDVFCLMLRMASCPVVTVQMNYLDRASRREILVVTDRHTFKADLISGVLEVDRTKENCMAAIDETFRLQHKAVMEEKFGDLCSREEGLEVMRMILAAEKATKENSWVNR